MDHHVFPEIASTYAKRSFRRSVSYSDCVDLLGRSRAPSFPYFNDWKFDCQSDLKPKLEVLLPDGRIEVVKDTEWQMFLYLQTCWGVGGYQKVSVALVIYEVRCVREDLTESCETREMILGVDQWFGTPQDKPVSSSGLNYLVGGQNDGYFWIDLPQEVVEVTSKLKYRASSLTMNRIGKHVVTASLIFRISNFYGELT
ncbi:hypothetical protein DY000_02021149 [Brassica cretica]|uniref:Uncharacterized protein n=1 Tax=Brassica cretica TaxID=69181 RepID=A0ABQ7EM13_BRACR|nr:hypothetical protein DY000_02021149 [Brassica cretica]